LIRFSKHIISKNKTEIIAISLAARTRTTKWERRKWQASEKKRVKLFRFCLSLKAAAAPTNSSSNGKRERKN
jgi:hypothetical protein